MPRCPAPADAWPPGASRWPRAKPTSARARTSRRCWAIRPNLREEARARGRHRCRVPVRCDGPARLRGNRGRRTPRRGLLRSRAPHLGRRADARARHGRGRGRRAPTSGSAGACARSRRERRPSGRRATTTARSGRTTTGLLGAECARYEPESAAGAVAGALRDLAASPAHRPPELIGGHPQGDPPPRPMRRRAAPRPWAPPSSARRAASACGAAPGRARPPDEARRDRSRPGPPP